jgi:hypothetical protein
MAHAQKKTISSFGETDESNRRGRQFSRLLAAEVGVTAVVMVVMLDTPYSEVV